MFNFPNDDRLRLKIFKALLKGNTVILEKDGRKFVPRNGNGVVVKIKNR